MTRKRCFQRLLDLAQIGLNSKRNSTNLKIYCEMIIILQEHGVYVGGEALPVDPRGVMLEWQKHLAPVIAMLKEQVIRGGFDTEKPTSYTLNLSFGIDGTKIVTSANVKDHLIVLFSAYLNSTPLESFHLCPHCGNVFVTVGSRKRTYCSMRCNVDFSTKQMRIKNEN
jgi:hypothetical protein